MTANQRDRPAAEAARRAKVDAAQRALSRKERNRRVLIIGSGAIAAVLLIVLVVAVILNNRPVQTAAAPAGATSDGGVVLAGEDSPTVVEVYVDLQCPFCAQFEATTGPWLKEQADAGNIRLEQHVISILDRASGGYSTRAANAAACVADDPAADYAAFTTSLFEQQPAEGGSGLPDATLVDLAKTAGAGESITECVDDVRFKPWIESTTDTATGERGVQGTPAVRVDGELLKTTAVPTQADIEAALAS